MKWIVEAESIDDIVLGRYAICDTPLIECRDCKHYDGRPCGIVDWYNTADDYCSRAERKDGEVDDSISD